MDSALLLGGVTVLSVAILYLVTDRRQLKTANKMRRESWQDSMDSSEWQEVRKQGIKLFSGRCSWCNAPFTNEVHLQTRAHLGHEGVFTDGVIGDLILLWGDGHKRAPPAHRPVKG